MDYLYFLLNTFVSFVIYIRNYVRSVRLVLSLKGPPAWPILGNVLLINNVKNTIYVLCAPATWASEFCMRYDGTKRILAKEDKNIRIPRICLSKGELEEIGTNAYQIYGSMLRCWISVLPFVVVYEPRHLKIVLGTKTSRKNMFYRILHNFIGKGLITNNGLKWRRHRKLIQPYFHNSILETYIMTFCENANELLRNLEGQTTVKITALINNCVLRILHETVLGVSLTNGDDDSPFRQGKMVLTQRIGKPWLLLENIFNCTSTAENELKQKKSLYDYTKTVLMRRRQEIRTTTSKCLMDMLIEISENNIDFTDEDIINEAITFMLAGQDSVGSGVAFTLFFIAKYGEIQTKILQEINKVYEQNPKFTTTGLNNMKYLEQCIKESLRLAPSVPIISRVLTEDVVLDGHTLPAGMNIFISPFVTHRLPHYFPDPLKFDPERFSQDNVEKLHPYAFTAFSMGPRNCIGYKFALLEMKAIISTILQQYCISLPPSHEDLTFSYRATLRAKGGIWLRLNPRN